MARTPTEKRYAKKVARHLEKGYPDAECELNYDSPFQLLIATILSAQCTDVRVNIVTGQLFADYPTAHDLAKVTIPQLEMAIKTTGFFRNKAKNIHECCRQLVDQYDGVVPKELDQLVELPGVGRKTANVVLGTAFQIPSGVVVDTHVGRITRRLGITHETDPVKVEQDLMQLLPKSDWIYYSHRMIHHGRQVCKARKPLCDDCSMVRFCPRIDVKA